jgi:hypothetical protein
VLENECKARMSKRDFLSPVHVAVLVFRILLPQALYSRIHDALGDGSFSTAAARIRDLLDTER